MNQGGTIAQYFPIVVGIILFGLFSAFIVYFVILYTRSQDRSKREKEQLQQELLRAEIEIKEATLQQVSQEIHDNFGQIASLIKINLQLVSGNLKPQEAEKVNESIDLIKQLIADMKSLSRSLKGDKLQQFGWIGTIEKDLARINAMQKVKVHLRLHGAPETIPFTDQVILYRIVQEMLHNLIKHAHAREASLHFAQENGQFTMEYTDDGVGFEPEAVLTSNGSGLENMEARAGQIGAKYQLKSTPGQGVQIRITKKIES